MTGNTRAVVYQQKIISVRYTVAADSSPSRNTVAPRAPLEI